MSQTTITQREEKRVWDKSTDEKHTFSLKRYCCYVLEVHDVHFNHDSAVFLPDRATEEGGGESDESHITGFVVLRAAYEQSKDNPSQKLLILGHTDTTGAAGYNVKLSQQRADNVLALLLGDRDGWVKICEAKHKVEDYQLILKWTDDHKGWNCDPGAIDNKNGPQTKAAVKTFQDTYNQTYSKNIKVDGDVGKETWGAFFDLYMERLILVMDTDQAGLAELQHSLKDKFLDGSKKTVGCGEHFPIEERRRDNYRSVTNRRIEILFFDPGEEPKLDCHPKPGQCLFKKCELNNPIIYDFRRIDPGKVKVPTFRISLRLGSIEELFPNAPDTQRGRMERLQVLGLFYFPLNHPRANVAFTGSPAVGGTSPTPAVRGAWEHFKTRVLNNADDATADQEIQRMLNERVIDGGNLPPPAAEGATPGEANFAKMRIPGGYTFMGPIGLNSAPAYPAEFGSADIYSFETLVRRDNPILGKVPLVAFVERQSGTTGKWEPASGVDVYVQLQPPNALPAFDPSRPPASQFNRPPIRQSTVGPVAPPAGANGPVATGMGPAALTNREEHPTGVRAPDPSDPQGLNCPSDRGGERGKGSLTTGTDVAGVIFEIASRPGFNVAHSVTPPASPRAMSHDPYPVAENAASGTDHLHAVKAKTNAKGEAGVIFTPSRCGGDCYRIRAYVGPKALQGPGSDGTGDRAVKAETGTIVLWRNLRISRYLRQRVNNPSPVLLSEVNGPPYSIPDANRYLQRVRVNNAAGVTVGLATADFSALGTAAAPFDGIMLQWARGFVEVELDRAAQAALPEIMTQSDWQAARRMALQDGQAALAGLTLNHLNLPILFHMEPGSSITVDNAVVHLPMRTPEAYNAHPSVTAAQQINIAELAPNASLRNRLKSLFSSYMLNGFLRSISNNGFESGITVIQGGFGGTWQFIGRMDGFSGVAKSYRGCYVWLGAASYPTTIQPPIVSGMVYGYTANTCHEIGHCCFRTHGPGFRSGGKAPGGANAARHDVQTNNESICVMSYQDCEGQFCARCLFAFRGWNELTV